jgi:hypothetical protein
MCGGFWTYRVMSFFYSSEKGILVGHTSDGFVVTIVIVSYAKQPFLELAVDSS